MAGMRAEGLPTGMLAIATDEARARILVTYVGGDRKEIPPHFSIFLLPHIIGIPLPLDVSASKLNGWKMWASIELASEGH